MTDLIADPIVQEALSIEGYTHMRKLPSGEWAGLFKFLFTIGLVVGIDMTGYRIRYCFADEKSALQSLENYDGYGDPTGPWIKAKGRDKDGTFRS